MEFDAEKVALKVYAIIDVFGWFLSY